MRMHTKLLTILCIILMSVDISLASGASRKYQETELYDYYWESNMAMLDGFSYELQNETRPIGYIIVYGARRGRRGEVQRRINCMKNYMLQRRGIPANQITIVHGGYREHSVMEMWIVPQGERLPAATPAVKPKDVRLRRGRIRYTCEV